MTYEAAINLELSTLKLLNKYRDIWHYDLNKLLPKEQIN